MGIGSQNTHTILTTAAASFNTSTGSYHGEVKRGNNSPTNSLDKAVHNNLEVQTQINVRNEVERYKSQVKEVKLVQNYARFSTFSFPLQLSEYISMIDELNIQFRDIVLDENGMLYCECLKFKKY